MKADKYKAIKQQLQAEQSKLTKQIEEHRVPLSVSTLPDNELQSGSSDESVHWSRPQSAFEFAARLLKLWPKQQADFLLYLSERLPHLPPHIREAIVTLVDAADASSSDSSNRGGAP